MEEPPANEGGAVPEPELDDTREPELIPAGEEMTGQEAIQKVEPEPEEQPSEPSEPLLELDRAVEQVPAALREEMRELLRADFREVVRWEV